MENLIGRAGRNERRRRDAAAAAAAAAVAPFSSSRLVRAIPLVPPAWVRSARRFHCAGIEIQSTTGPANVDSLR